MLNNEELMLDEVVKNRKKARVVLTVSIISLIISLILAAIMFMLLVFAIGLSPKALPNTELIKGYFLILTPSILSIFFIIVGIFVYKGKRWALVLAPYVWILIIALLYMISMLR